MGLIDLASSNSLWKGIDYYQRKKVTSIKKIDDNSFESEVLGSSGAYHILIDTEHPRKSKCTCPFADGRRVVCKHMVATYFTVHPEEAKRLIEYAEECEREEEAYWQQEYEEIERYVNSLTEEQVRAQLIAYMIDEMERRY